MLVHVTLYFLFVLSSIVNSLPTIDEITNSNHTITPFNGFITGNANGITNSIFFNTLNPYNQYGSTATHLSQGQAAGIQFAGPAGFARLSNSQIIMRGGTVPALARIYIAQDSGFNTPGYVIVDTGFCTIPANTQVAVMTDYSMVDVALSPGEHYW